MNSGAHAYDAVAKTFHWLIAALLVVQYAIAWSMPNIRPGQLPGFLVNLHFSIGVTILAAMGLRLMWRQMTSVPAPPADLPTWQQHVSRLTHFTLYGLLVVVPLTGWVWASAKGLTINAFGLIALPPIAGHNAESANIAGQFHAVLATVILAFVAVHALAALWHHFIRRDEVLRRMLPEVSPHTN